MKLTAIFPVIGRACEATLQPVMDRLKIKRLDLNFKLTELLTGCANFKAYLYRFKLINTNVCDCASETIFNIILDCDVSQSKTTIYSRV
jgi:hypothetical protein